MPDRQQAAAALAQDAGGALVHAHRAVAGLGVAQPELEARGRARGAGVKRVPTSLAGRGRAAGSRRRSRRRSRRGSRRRPPSRRRAPCCASRRARAARCARRSRSASSSAGSLTSADQLGVGVAGAGPPCGARRCRSAAPAACASSMIATWAARKSLSPKVISSVAVVSFSFTTGHHPPLEQPAQGLARVQVVGPHLQVGRRSAAPGRRGPRAPSEPLLVGAEEAPLADRGGRLQLVDRARAQLPAP